jgi:hypothetical protein
MRDLGYVDGQNVNLILRYDIASLDEVNTAAAEGVQAKPDVIVADGDPRALAVKRLTSTIPIVFSLSSDPIGFGLVESFARRGGNVTGMSGASVEISGKELELGVQLQCSCRRMSSPGGQSREFDFLLNQPAEVAKGHREPNNAEATLDHARLAAPCQGYGSTSVAWAASARGTV